MSTDSALGTAKHPLKMRINKRFFVEMLTRDIELEDAILDLLDNCLDGVIRTTETALTGRKPYAGYWAKLTLAQNKFVIEDNCGGIPASLIERAFGIGRQYDPTENYRTIGIYGIGMKRAIFKMALESRVESHSTFGFRVGIDEDWLKDETDTGWKLDYKRTSLDIRKGTRITMNKLRPEIGQQLGSKPFEARLHSFISKHYAIILDKGFRVDINGTRVVPAPLELLAAPLASIKSDDPALAPYMLHQDTGKVTVRMWVGMYQSPPAADGDEEAETEQRQSADNSGWTIICNDRAIVSNDTTILTGWGVAFTSSASDLYRPCNSPSSQISTPCSASCCSCSRLPIMGASVKYSSLARILMARDLPEF